jgi:nicotinamide-nucleotide amidase
VRGGLRPSAHASAAAGAAGPLAYNPTVRTADAHAILLTVGDEITGGDVENTNGSWLARRLAEAGVSVRMLAAVPDDVGEIARFVRDRRPECELMIVTGGLGGTPDDVTREGIAEGFGVGVREHEDAAAVLRAHFGDRLGDYARRFAMLPDGAEPIRNPLGGAPGFTIGNVHALPGVPAEMRATYDELVRGLGWVGDPRAPIRSVRLMYQTTESEIVVVLEGAADRHPAVAVGSYPLFEDGAKRVEIVLKSRDDRALEEAAAWVSGAVDEVLSA